MKAIHYINQFFGQIGGEDAADAGPTFHSPLVGSSVMLNDLMPHVEVTHTVICGDNYINEWTDEVLTTILSWLENVDFDIFIAGPAFMAGRYGVGCGLVCSAVSERFGVPVLTSMNEENPGVELYRKSAYVFKGGRKATYMRQDMGTLAGFAEKLALGVPLGTADEEGYFGRGIRRQYFPKDGVPACDRMFDMLMKKLKNEPFQTELPIPKPDIVPIAPAVPDMKASTVALVTSGGIVPEGNPDRIQSASATLWGAYDIAGMERLNAGDFVTVHAGYDSAAANEDPNRVLPLDAVRALERQGQIGAVYPRFFATVGTGTAQKDASRMSREIIALLRDDQVDAVLLVTT